VPLVRRITAPIHALAESDGTDEGVGGMVTKLRAAEMVTRAGMHALLGDGFHARLCDVLTNEKAGTLFLPSKRRMSSRDRFLAFSGRAQGALVVDEGAHRAIVDKGKSLLPAGIAAVRGSFTVGDMVDIAAERGEVFARGMVNYTSADLETIKGRKTHEIAACLGHKTFDEAVHRDNLVVLEENDAG
jgi:glutamate 5-kinase